MSAIRSSKPLSISAATMSARGTMTSSTSRSPRARMLSTRSRSCGSIGWVSASRSSIHSSKLSRRSPPALRARCPPPSQERRSCPREVLELAPPLRGFLDDDGLSFISMFHTAGRFKARTGRMPPDHRTPLFHQMAGRSDGLFGQMGSAAPKSDGRARSGATHPNSLDRNTLRRQSWRQDGTWLFSMPATARTPGQSPAAAPGRSG